MMPARQPWLPGLGHELPAPPEPCAWPIPTLDLGMQADRVVPPVAMWGAGSTRRAMPGTWHFYTVDRNITGVWKDPERLPATGCAVAVEPNFSLWPDDPPELAWREIFRKRALARWWQAAGVRIIVDLNVTAAWDYLTLAGVPRGWRAYATRLHYRTTLAELDAQHARAVAHAGTEDVLFVVYSGGPHDAAYCASRGWVHLPNHWRVVTGRDVPHGKPIEQPGRRWLAGLRW